MGVTHEEDLCRTEPLPRATGSQECKRKLWSILRNETNARAAGRKPRSDRGKKRKGNDPLDLLPPKLKQGYDANVKLRPLALGDLVLRKVVGATKDPSWGKLEPNWEGPFRITSVAGIGAYYLEDLDEKVEPRPWNVNNLKMYYY